MPVSSLLGKVLFFDRYLFFYKRKKYFFSVDVFELRTFRISSRTRLPHGKTSLLVARKTIFVDPQGTCVAIIKLSRNERVVKLIATNRLFTFCIPESEN